MQASPLRTLKDERASQISRNTLSTIDFRVPVLASPHRHQ
jgi:hypothetical protein